MAAPTVTCYPVTGTACTKGSAQTQVDYGSVLAGADSPVKGMVYTPSGNSLSSVKFWMQANFPDTNLTHRTKAQTACTDPSTMDPDDSGFADTPTSEAGGVDIVDGSGSTTVADGADSERVYSGVKVGAGAADGQNTCNMRLSYQYP